MTCIIANARYARLTFALLLAGPLAPSNLRLAWDGPASGNLQIFPFGFDRVVDLIPIRNAYVMASIHFLMQVIKGLQDAYLRTRLSSSPCSSLKCTGLSLKFLLLPIKRDGIDVFCVYHCCLKRRGTQGFPLKDIPNKQP